MPSPEVESPTVLPTLPNRPPAVLVTPPTVEPRVSPRSPTRLSVKAESCRINCSKVVKGMVGDVLLLSWLPGMLIDSEDLGI